LKKFQDLKLNNMKYIKRTYRITPAHDKKVKKSAKKTKQSESEVIRKSIDYLTPDTY